MLVATGLPVDLAQPCSITASRCQLRSRQMLCAAVTVLIQQHSLPFTDIGMPCVLDTRGSRHPFFAKNAFCHDGGARSPPPRRCAARLDPGLFAKHAFVQVSNGGHLRSDPVFCSWTCDQGSDCWL